MNSTKNSFNTNKQMINKVAKEESMLKSYNETFYTSLKSIQFLSNPLQKEEKLVYKFEQNDNAPVSSTIGQLESMLDELLLTNEKIKENMKDLSKEIKDLKDQVQNVDDDNLEVYRPEVEKLKNVLNEFMENQKLENERLNEEINLLEKEKVEIQQSIYDALGYLHKLEKQVGIKSKTYTYYYDQTLSENELSSKFIIKDENI
jgi:chromosome segregation ATPase